MRIKPLTRPAWFLVATTLLAVLEVPVVWAQSEEVPMQTIRLTSDAFEAGGLMPSKYTCDGKDLSPSIRWQGVPKNTQSIALMMDDPDAPMGTWVHWVLYDLPPTIDMLPEGLPRLAKLANAEKQGMTDFKRVGYGGPCPPSGTHRYVFKIYALDSMLALKEGATKAELLKAMEGHVLAEGELVGRYERS